MRILARVSRSALLPLLTASMLWPAGPAPAASKDITKEDVERHPDIVEMRKKVAESPDDAGLHNDLGNLYARVGWDDLAIEEYRFSTRLDREMYIAWTNLGTLYAKRGDLGKAKSAFETAIRIQPRAALAHYNLGVVLDHSGDYDGAIASYVTAARFDPGLLDPSVNPPVVNNERLLEVRTLLYLEDVGSAALPLEKSPVTRGGRAPAEAPPLLPPAPSSPASGPAASEPAPPSPAPAPPPPEVDPRSGKPVRGALDMKRERRPKESASPETPPSPAPTTPPPGS